MNFFADSLTDGQGAPALVLGLGGIVVMYVVLRPMMRRKKDPFAKPFQSTSLSQQRSVERQMESLLVELSEMSRQMTAQLDTRSAKLEALIADADGRIAQLEALKNQAPPSPTQRFTMTLPELEPARPTPPPPEPERIPEQHATVYRMADDGKTMPQIAAELRRPSGEIELILALRSRA